MIKRKYILRTLLAINILLFCYSYCLDEKIKSYLDIFSGYSYSIINKKTNVVNFGCLYNRYYEAPVLQISNERYIKSKNQFDYFNEGIKFGQSRDVDLVNTSHNCISTTQRIFNYNIDRNIKTEYNNYILQTLIGPQGMYLHRPTIQILSDSSNDFCHVALVNTDIIRYHFDLLINGQIQDHNWDRNTTISNSAIKDGLISITVIDPCDRQNDRNYKLKI